MCLGNTLVCLNKYLHLECFLITFEKKLRLFLTYMNHVTHVLDIFNVPELFLKDLIRVCK